MFRQVSRHFNKIPKHSVALSRRLYQTQSSGTNLRYIGLTGVIAGGIGYGLASQQVKTTEKAEISERPQVPVPSTPTRETLQTVFKELQNILPSEHVTLDDRILEMHGYSNNSYHDNSAPHIVVFPESTAQVSQIVEIAHRYDIPIIPFSGGTSLEGHFSAPKGGICISFSEHMNQIIEFHPDDMDIVLQPGVKWEELNEYLKPSGLFFPMDPGPGACIGGMVGTSCSGTNAVRYGTMKEWVINLTVVTADGKIIKTRQRPRKSSAGYDLTRLMIGSEGTLGIVTEITLKLAVIPVHETVAVCDFPTIHDAAAVVPDLVKAGVQIGAVELLDGTMMKAIRLANPDLGYEAKPTLFFKFSGGSKSSVENDIKLVNKIAENHKGGKFRYAKNQEEKEALWEGRKIALWSSTLLKEGSSVWTTDVVVPVSKLADVIKETELDIKESILPCPIVGHVGDGNFHVFILFDKHNSTEYEEAKRLNNNLLERAIKYEGSVTGEHGVGIGKKVYLEKELGENTVDLMKSIKIAIDPKGLLNPEKVLP